jgi:hypothetical protein
MTQGVEATRREPCALRGTLEPLGRRLGVQRVTELVGEHEPRVPPDATGLQLLAVLARAMLAKGRHGVIVQRDRGVARVRLRVGLHGDLVRHEDERLPDRDDGLVEVGRIPAQTERLSTTDAPFCSPRGFHAGDHMAASG